MRKIIFIFIICCLFLNCSFVPIKLDYIKENEVECFEKQGYIIIYNKEYRETYLTCGLMEVGVCYIVKKKKTNKYYNACLETRDYNIFINKLECLPNYNNNRE